MPAYSSSRPGYPSDGGPVVDESARPEPPEAPGGRWRPAAIGAAASIAVVAVCRFLEAAPGEPAGLRWLRVVADHPVRTALAGTLAVLALAPRARSPPP